MKKKDDPRHKMRVQTIKTLFEQSFRDDVQNQINPATKEITKDLAKIDNIIKLNAPAWPISQISPIDLATLRLAVWELLFKTQKEPYKAVIDEAVEIAKEYGNESSPSFINGVLGSVVSKNLKN